MALTVASIALYGAGITSTISPCVLPLVPGYLAVLADSASPGARPRPHRVAIFAAGAIGTFVALGGIVAAVGLALTATVALLQRLAGLGLIAFGTVMLLAKSGRAIGEFRVVRALPPQPNLRALLLGVGCGAAWSPCVGPLLGAALTAAGGSGSVWRGSWLLFSFGCGVLTPFFAASCLKSPLAPRRARLAGRWLSTVSAAVMLGFGVVLTAGWYTALVQRLGVIT
jgi:cytochrome c-type biogenesis protein